VPNTGEVKSSALQLSRFHVVIEDLDKHNFPADCDVDSVPLLDIVGGTVLFAMWANESAKFIPLLLLPKFSMSTTVYQFDIFHNRH
jgi:hypothetical protein